jgi:hypothetical protein
VLNLVIETDGKVNFSASRRNRMSNSRNRKLLGT